MGKMMMNKDIIVSGLPGTCGDVMGIVMAHVNY